MSEQVGPYDTTSFGMYPDYYDDPEVCEICGEQSSDLEFDHNDYLLCGYCREQESYKEIPVDKVEEVNPLEEFLKEVENDAA